MPIGFERRALLRALAGGSALGSAALALGQSARNSAPPWKYTQLDPDDVAQEAYRLFLPDGHCMYAVFTSVVRPAAEELGESFRSFPFEMMSYGLGGVAGWGSLCGALNGAAAALALLAPGTPQRDEMTRRLFRWYEATSLPAFVSRGATEQIVSTIAGSVLCHVSAGRWCRAARKPFFSVVRRERCMRLSADVARQMVVLLNGKAEAPGLSAATRRCQSCHAPEAAERTSFGQSECNSCHKPHPEMP
jgi:hypothetical protein